VSASLGGAAGGRGVDQLDPPADGVRMNGPVVVIGAGLAGAHVVATLRKKGFDGPVTLVGEEPVRPYERPPLSKGILLGTKAPDSAFVHPADYYGRHAITPHFGDAAVAIHKNAQTVRLASGRVLPYAHLVLATGARPRRLPDQPDLAGVLTLRTLPDAERLRASLTPDARVVVVGGGWIGLEVAAAARLHGCDVTVLTLDSLPLVTVLGERMGRHFAELHRSHGVDVRTGVTVEGLEGADGRVTGVRAGGALLPADVVVVGIGAVPETSLAAASGLAVDRGVLVDEHLRTNHPEILAAGDVANAAHATLGRLRVEHWDNAIRQGKLAAATILGHDAAYDWQPYFYTDQYDLGMEYVGRGGPHDDVVVRGDEASGEFIAFWLADGVLTAAMNVNTWDVNDTLRTLLGRRIAPERLTDPTIPLADLG